MSAKEPSYPDMLLNAGGMTINANGATSDVGQIATTPGLVYNSSLAAVTAGSSVTLTDAGGRQVGPFTMTAKFPDSFSVTGFSTLTTVNRSHPLTISWTVHDRRLCRIGGVYHSTQHSDPACRWGPPRFWRTRHLH